MNAGRVNNPRSGADAKELSKCCLVSSKFRLIAIENTLWKKLCQERWKSKKKEINTFEVSHRVFYKDIHPSLSIKEIKRILEKRSVYCKGLLERSEFIDLLLKSTPKPDYGWYPSKWMATYIVTELDSKRCKITKDELCSIKWDFRFNQWPEDHPGGAEAQFMPDYTFKANIFEHEMKWRFYADHIQVEQYPPLTCYRTDDWGWIIKNSYVTYRSK